MRTIKSTTRKKGRSPARSIRSATKTRTVRRSASTTRTPRSHHPTAAIDLAMYKLYCFENNIVFRILRDRDEPTRARAPTLVKTRAYHVQELEAVQDVTVHGFQKKQALTQRLDAKQLDRVKRDVRHVSEGFARGVSDFVNKELWRTGSSKKVSNGFCKLWEIYMSVPELVPPKDTVRVFHIAEMPGQWINATMNYLQLRTVAKDYEWRAMSLNPNHPLNVRKYGKGIFRDDYNMVRTFPDRWTYGEDGTGDFTVPSNIRWYRSYVRNWLSANPDGTSSPPTRSQTKLDLIVGDAGMSGDAVSLRDLQLIEYAQMAMVAACGNEGTSCVTKHFLPYIRSIPETVHATGFFLGLLYAYHTMFEELCLVKPLTSNPDSGEFYVVGLRMRPLSDAHVSKTVDVIETFEANGCFFPESAIPLSFRAQVVEFVKKMSRNIADQYDIQNTVLACFAEPHASSTRCTSRFAALDAARAARVEKWIELFRFDLSDRSINMQPPKRPRPRSKPTRKTKRRARSAKPA